MSDYIGQVFQTNGGTDCVVIKYNGKAISLRRGGQYRA